MNSQTLEPAPDAFQVAHGSEAYRPACHFTSRAGWINDPNGLVYHQGEYHLFYQHYPHATVWGPMHWGHAVSPDLAHWEELPIALEPDDDGMVFSGSAVDDAENTSGLVPGGGLVAIYTNHRDASPAAVQTQAIAFSTDRGRTWTKYSGNPVLESPDPAHARDFRDPKVFRHGDAWCMVLAVGDHLEFYRSVNLREWSPAGRFDWPLALGVWECPDLFPLERPDGMGQAWVLVLSVGDGAPNGGSGTLYFVGDFDGCRFRSRQEPQWLDWGTDNYAGVTWNDAPRGERLFIGWMNNWRYARDIPMAGDGQRGAMTLPRRLSLAPGGTADELVLVQEAAQSVVTCRGLERRIPDTEGSGTVGYGRFPLCGEYDLTLDASAVDGRAGVRFRFEPGEVLELAWWPDQSSLILDRGQAGGADCHPHFGDVQVIPLKQAGRRLGLRIHLDRTSIEVLAEGGRSVATALIFPAPGTDQVKIEFFADKGAIRIPEFHFWPWPRVF